MPLNFAFSRIRAHEGNSQALHNQLANNDWEVLQGAQVWGTFFGLFGLASNELILVTMDDVSAMNERLTGLDSIQRVDTLYLEPTVRPEGYETRTKEGLYVFRFFAIENKNVNEIAQLSKTAWKTFETSDEYQAIPQALFCEQDRSKKRGRILLCTWYDGLNSWQTSRTPHPSASDNFRRRAQLTQRTKAYATRLIVT